MKQKTKPTIIMVAAAVVIFAVVMAFLGAGGGIEYQFEDSAFSIHTALWKDWTVAYEEIESIELRHDLDAGTRTLGYGSGKLRIGIYKNAEFGAYHRYTYTRCNDLVVLRLKDKTILVIGGEETSASDALYEAICAGLGTEGFAEPGK